MEHALQAGVGVGGELRFLMVNGDLMGKTPEAALKGDFPFAPLS